MVWQNYAELRVSGTDCIKTYSPSHIDLLNRASFDTEANGVEIMASKSCIWGIRLDNMPYVTGEDTLSRIFDEENDEDSADKK
jgi:hypothetical protein